MNEPELQTKLVELMSEITAAPSIDRHTVDLPAAPAPDSRAERLRQTVHSLQEALDHLRLTVKYLVFDLEATRRENLYLRRMLEETAGEND